MMVLTMVFVIIINSAIPLPPIATLLGVEFSENSNTVTIHWNKTQGRIDEYHAIAKGECGECVDNLGMIDRENNTLSCSGWMPNGQTCNVMMTAIISRCPGFENLTTPLQIPILLQCKYSDIIIHKLHVDENKRNSVS